MSDFAVVVVAPVTPTLRDRTLPGHQISKASPAHRRLSHTLLVLFASNANPMAFPHRHASVSSPTQAPVHRVKMAPVLVRARHLVFGQRAHVLPLPSAFCLRVVGGLQAPSPGRPSRHGVRAVLLGVHHRVRGDPGGECRRTSTMVLFSL